MHRRLCSLVVFAVVNVSLLLASSDGSAAPGKRIRARLNSNMQQPVAWGRQSAVVGRPGQLPPGTIVRLPGPLGEAGRIPRRLPGRGIHLPQQLPPGTIITGPARLPHPRGISDRPVSLPGRGNPFPVVLSPTR